MLKYVGLRKLPTITWNYASVFILQGTGLVLGLLITIFLTKVLSAPEYGYYAITLTAINICAWLSIVGFDVLSIREYSQKSNENRKSLFLGTTLTMLGGVIILSLILTFVTWFFFPKILHYEHNLIILGVIVPILWMTRMIASALIGLGRPIIGYLPERIFREPMFAIILLAFLAFGLQLNSTVALTSLLISYLMVCLISIVYFKSNILKNISPRFGGGIEFRNFLFGSIRIGTASVLQLITHRIDLILIFYFLGAEKAGVYSIAILISEAAGVVGLTIGSVGGREISRRRDEGHERQRHVINQLRKFGLLFSTAIYVFFLLFGSTLLLWFFGEAFQDAYVPMLVLSFIHIIRSLAGYPSIVLSVTFSEKKLIPQAFIALFVTLILAIILISNFGFIGGAIATLIGAISFNVGLWYETRKNLRTGV